jgi:hypothetical protein
MQRLSDCPSVARAQLTGYGFTSRTRRAELEEYIGELEQENSELRDENQRQSDKIAELELEGQENA